MCRILPLMPLFQEPQDKMGALSRMDVPALQNWPCCCPSCSRNNKGPWLQDSISPRTSRATRGAGRDVCDNRINANRKNVPELMGREERVSAVGRDIPTLVGRWGAGTAGPSAWAVERALHCLVSSWLWPSSRRELGAAEWFPRPWDIPKWLLHLTVAEIT